MRNVSDCRHFCTFEICELPQPRWEVSQAVSHCLVVVLFFCFEFFWRSRQLPSASSSLRTPARLQDVLDESCCSDVEDELAPDVAFDHWPTHLNNRVLRRVCLMTGRQACHRVFAPSRRDQGRERILVLPRLFAPLRRNPGGIDREVSLLWLFRRGCQH